MRRHASVSSCGTLDREARQYLSRLYGDFCQQNGITGVMTYTSPVLFHIFEGSEEATSALVKKLGEDLYQGAFEIVVTEEIKDRLFSEWEFEQDAPVPILSKMVEVMVPNLHQCSDGMSDYLVRYLATHYSKTL